MKENLEKVQDTQVQWYFWELSSYDSTANTKIGSACYLIRVRPKYDLIPMPYYI